MTNMDTVNMQGPVRTAAVLRLEGCERSACSGGDDRNQQDEHLPDVNLSAYDCVFNRYNLPGIDGTAVQCDLLSALGAEDTADSTTAAEGATGSNPSGETGANPVKLQSITPPSRRLAALLRSLERPYEGSDATAGTSAAATPCNPAAGSSTGACDLDGWCSTLPGGPPAVVAMRLDINPAQKQQPTPDANATATSPPPAATRPDPAAAFPPPWLPSLARSLTFLDLSDSRHLDPAAWDLSLLAALPRLAFLGLHSAVLVSALPTDLAARLPALRVLDLCNAKVQLPARQVEDMLVGLCGGTQMGHAVLPSASPPGGPQGRCHPLVVTTVGNVGPQPPTRRTRLVTHSPAELSIKYDSLADVEGEDGKAGTKKTGNSPDWVSLNSAPAIRAVRASLERAFLSYGREVWWHVRVPSSADPVAESVVSQPLDITMVRLLYDLGLLPPLPEEEGEEEEKEEEEVGRGQQAGSGGKEGDDEDVGKELLIKISFSPASVNVKRPRLPHVQLGLAWPYTALRLDTPSWSHKQKLHSAFREKLTARLSARQWRLLLGVQDSASGLRMGPGSGDAAAAASRPPAPDALGPLQAADATSGDPFEVQQLSFQALEQRERMSAGGLLAAGTGCAVGMLSGGARHRTYCQSSLELGAEKDADYAKDAARARPPAATQVAVPTPVALAARTEARRLLVAGLVGSSVAGVSPAPRGSTSVAILLKAMRLEARLFGRVRRVSILPRGHHAYTTTHAARYWASVRALYDTLMADPRVRSTVLLGAIPLAAAAELPVAELRSLVAKLDRAARKGQGADVTGHGGLEELAVAAADLADLEALQKQIAAGGRLETPVPVFPEDWQPAERKVDSLCAWHIANPWVWPHGGVLHGAVARGHPRTVTWLLDRGLPLDGRISRWELSPLHLCCMRPVQWSVMHHICSLFRVPVSGAGSRSDEDPGSKDDDDDDDDDGDDAGYDSSGEYSACMAALDSKLGIPTRGVFVRAKDLLFPRVCGTTKDGLRRSSTEAFFSPLWYGADDEMRPGDNAFLKMQTPHVQTLPCTAPYKAATAAIAPSQGGPVSAAALAACASPMLRLLLERGPPDLCARSWCGLLPLHYAAASCGVEAVAALALAGASLRAPLPGSLVGPLHVLAYRSGRRFSGLAPRAAARLLACQPTISPADVLTARDEWRGCPLSYLVMESKTLGAGDLGALVATLRGAMGHGAVPQEAVDGVARALCHCLVAMQVEHCRVLLQHFPEAATAHLPPIGATPLHLACMLPAWNDAKSTEVFGVMVNGEQIDRRSRVPQSVRDQSPPFVPPAAMLPVTASGAAPAATTAAATGCSGAEGPRATGSGGGGKELLLLGGGSSKSVTGRDGRADEDRSEADERWPFWPYVLIDRGPHAKEDDGETESGAMQRCAEVQLQLVHLLLATGATVDATDDAGCTPLMVAAMAGSAAVVGALLARGASPTAFAPLLNVQHERCSGRRIPRMQESPSMFCLGLDYCLLLPPHLQTLDGPLPPGAWQPAGPAPKGREDEEEDGTQRRVSTAGPEASEPSPNQEKYCPGDEVLHRFSGRDGKESEAAKRRKEKKAPRDGLYSDFRLTPLGAAVIRVMQHMAAQRQGAGVFVGNQADGTGGSFKLTFNDSTGRGRVSRWGDGILWLLLRHGPPGLRRRVVEVLRRADILELINELPRTAIWVVADTLPGNRYTPFSERAAREACAALSPLTTSALDGAIRKALVLAVMEAGRVASTIYELHGRQGAAQNEGGAVWGPHEDEVLGDLVTTGLYPLFISANVTNGEASILRMSTQLLTMATRLVLGKQALLRAHTQQFPPAGSPDTAAGGGTSSESWSLDKIETLMLGSFNTACRVAQHRVVMAGAAGQAAAGTDPAGGGVQRGGGAGQTAAGGSGAVVGGAGGDDGGGGGGSMSTVMVLHTLDDVEFGLAYARVAEVLPPVASMRVALGHSAPAPDLSIRALADTLFKFVRTLCHISQKELDWVRLPGGVTATSVDGLFLPILPGETGWNVTDMFRPRNFGFRLTFAYTRRTITLELMALTLMRTVPIDVREPAAGLAAAGALAATSGSPSQADPAAAPAGQVPAGTGGGGDATSLRARVGVAPLAHGRAGEFRYWTRNPDVMRMEQVQSMAGRLETEAKKAHANWRQMPVPPAWWISGWLDRFVRLFLIAAVSGEGSSGKKLNLHTLYDSTVQGPWRGGDGSPAAGVPWSRLEAHVLSEVAALHPLSMATGASGDKEERPRDLAGRPISTKTLQRIERVMDNDVAAKMAAENEGSVADRSCIAFTTQWNKLAQRYKWPLRSPMEVQGAMHQLVRMSCNAYCISWETSLHQMMGLLMAGDVSPELRRETEAKLLSLASDSAFARRLVWGTCRGRREEARCLALLSGVVEFQPLLLEVLMQHEEACEALDQWQAEEHCWAVAVGPALARLEPGRLAQLLWEQRDLSAQPKVLPCSTPVPTTAGPQPEPEPGGYAGAGEKPTGAADEAAAGGTSEATAPPAKGASTRGGVCLMYVCFRSREDLGKAVATPLVVYDSAPGGSAQSADASKGKVDVPGGLGSSMGAGSVVALLPMSLWEAAAVPGTQVPRRWDSRALSFFQLVFSRLPRGLQREDPHAAGRLWGRGLPAVLLHRRPVSSRWAPWPTLADVSEEAGVVGTLFDAHATEPLPWAWLQELDGSADGLVTYREFLLAYLRHRAGDFLSQPPKLTGAAVGGVPDAVGAATDETSTKMSAAAQRWQLASKKAVQGQMSQAFWDRANALRRLREDGVAGEGEQQVRAPTPLPGARSGAQLPGGVSLAGLDCVAAEELSEVQRAAWVAYTNLRAAARYLQAAKVEGNVSVSPATGAALPVAASALPRGSSRLDAWLAAEQAALENVMRGLQRPGSLFQSSRDGEGAAYGHGNHDYGNQNHSHTVHGGQESAEAAGPRCWLQVLSGVVAPGGGGSGAKEAPAPASSAHPRDVALLEVLLDLAANCRGAAHADLAAEAQEPLVGPMPGASQLLMSRTLAAAATQLGADAAAQVASAVGALVQQTAAATSAQDGLAPPVGGVDEVFCASALRLAAEEVWAFVTDMQSLVDNMVSPLVAAADQSVPIIQRESISTIFGDTNIELILEYETELLKLLTVHWRASARTGLVAPSVCGPAQHLITSMQRRVAGSRLWAYRGEFAPSAEELGVDPLSGGVQVRPVLTDPGVAEEVLELLLRLATAYQRYLDKIDEALRELLSCLERDEKGTFQALLRRFARPRKVRRGARAAAAQREDGGPAADDEADAESADDSGEDGANVDEAAAEAASGGSAKTESGNGGKGKGKDKAGRQGVGVHLDLPPHHVRPLLSVRQLARYGPGAELEACLRKPAAHLATLAFLSTVCRSITAAQDQLPEVEAAASSALSRGAATRGEDSDPGRASSDPAAPLPLASKARAAVAGSVGVSGKPGAAKGGVGHVRNGVGAAAGRTAGKRPLVVPGGGVVGFLRRAWQRLAGVQMARVLPLVGNVHPLYEMNPARPGAPGAPRASMAEHRVVLRGVGSAVLAAEAAGRGGAALGLQRTLAERLDVWMEERLLAGDLASRLLLAACSALTCLTWRVVPLLSERRRYLEDLRVANNMLHHRQVIRELERSINVRPPDDEALDQEVAALHAAIKHAVEEAAKEMDLGEGDTSKMSPMSVDAEFWVKKGPCRVKELEPLRAAIRLAERYTLHTTFGGARLLSNARRCAARAAAGAAAAGDKSGAEGRGGKGKDADGAAAPRVTLDSDSDEAERVLDAIAAPAKGGGAKKEAAVQPSKKEPTASAGGEQRGEGVANPAGAVQLVKLFGSRSHGAAEVEGSGSGGPKAAWGGGAASGMLAAVKAMQNASKFRVALRRAVRRREHARRRWDKTLFLVMESGELDEAYLAGEHAATVSQLRRAAALAAWRHLRGVGSDALMVFGAVAFRDVGRLFAPAMALFLMAFPFTVLGVALQVSPSTSHQRLLMGALVGAYVLSGFCAMSAAVAQLRRDPSQLKVYRPSDTIRFPNFRKGTALASWKAHWVNVFALFTLVLEFWQLCAFSYQRRVPYPEASFLKRIFPWALLDLGPAAYFLQVFALLAFMVVWIAVFFPQAPAGLKRVIMPFLGQAAYLTITSGLLSQLDCRMTDGALVRNPDITCWTDPRHVYGAVAAMLALGLYVPRATLTPFEVFFPSENLDIKYRGLYVRVVQLLRLGMAGYNLFFADAYPLTVMTANAGVCAVLAIMTAIMRPCCIGAVNIGRGTGFVLATWSQAVSVAALRLSPNVFMDADNRQWYTDSWSYVYTLVAGWVVIGAGGYLLLRRHLRLRDSAAIKFSLKRSPFNYTLQWAPPGYETPASGRGGGKAPATALQQAKQLPTSPPPGPGASGDAGGGTARAEPGQVGDGEPQYEPGVVAKVRTGGDATGGSEREGKGSDSEGGGDKDRKGSEDEEEEEEDVSLGDSDEASDNRGKRRDDSSDDLRSTTGRGKKQRRRRVSPQAAALGAALGLPVVSRKLTRQLKEQGLLSPADEMRAYVAKLVRRAERRLQEEGSGSDSSGGPQGAHFDEDDDDSEEVEGEVGEEEKEREGKMVEKGRKEKEGEEKEGEEGEGESESGASADQRLRQE